MPLFLAFPLFLFWVFLAYLRPSFPWPHALALPFFLFLEPLILSLPLLALEPFAPVSFLDGLHPIMKSFAQTVSPLPATIEQGMKALLSSFPLWKYAGGR